MARPRVGLVCGHFDPVRDGVADYTRQLAGALRATGFDTLVCTAHAYAGPPDQTVGVTHAWNLLGVLRAARGLARLRLDLVHVQFAPSAFGFSRAVGLLPRLLPVGTPVLATLHEYGVWRATGTAGRLRAAAWSALERRALLDRETLTLTLQASRLLVVAAEHAAVLRARFPGLDLQAVHVPIAPNIPVTATQDEDGAAVRAALGLPHGCRLVVFFGFLHPVKGLDVLVEAVAELRRDLPGLRLVLAGGGESHSVSPEAGAALRRRLADLARRRGVEIVFTGYLPAADASRLLRAAEVVVLPFDDGVTAKSGSLLTALAHGVPVVAAAPPGAVTGPTEVDGVLRVPPRDTSALAQALRMVLCEGDLARRLAAAGRASTAGRTWPAIAAVHARLYAEVLAGTVPLPASLESQPGEGG